MMLRKGTFVLAVALVALPAAWLEHDSEAATGPAAIRITNREVSYARVDVGRSGRSAGDMEIIKQLLFNRRITPKPIGHAEFVCTFTIPPSRSCRGTIFLPRGKIVVGGSIYVRQIYQLAILGGTGLYNNARGTMTATRFRRSPRSEILVFRLVG
ncbi:MAG: hypothetical protein M3123_00430 [Actinomycetota bacterium]|nr:hypothetical protein [Actinomycetota bacterium]